MELVACMMVYNDKPFLEACIGALRSFCDHLVIMDNGSDDGSGDLLHNLHSPSMTLIYHRQGSPPDYSLLRNRMLAFVPDGAWVLKWDPDELPSVGLAENVRRFLEADGDGHTGWTVPIYHLTHDRHTCLEWEAGFGHLRLFRKEPSVRFVGAVHEQIHIGDPWGGIHPESGMGVVHFSYFAQKRFRRKAEHYASIPGSSFLAPEDLTCRLAWPTMPLKVEFQADEAWLERIRDAD